MRIPKTCFTLSEVLITLGIIGVVAAITIPILFKNINNIIVTNQKKVMESKILQGLNLLNSQENGLSRDYANSEEFVRALSKYMKITTICAKDHLSDCFGYNSISYMNNDEIKVVKLSDITTASRLKLDSEYLDPAGFVMADGTPVIVSWNSRCSISAAESSLNSSDSNSGDVAIILDPDDQLKSIPTACFAAIYDSNGTRKPNMFSKDVLSYGSAVIGSTFPGIEIPDIGYVFNVGEQSSSWLLALYSKEELQKYDPNFPESLDGDYWGGAKKMCDEFDMKLPTKAELEKIYELRNNYPIINISTIIKTWSSSECNSAEVWSMDKAGNFICESKTEGYSNVLCVGKE